MNEGGLQEVTYVILETPSEKLFFSKMSLLGLEQSVQSYFHASAKTFCESTKQAYVAEIHCASLVAIIIIYGNAIPSLKSRCALCEPVPRTVSKLDLSKD